MKLPLFVWAIFVTAILLLVRGDSLYVSDFQKSIHYFQMDAASGLGKGESPELNLASLLEARTDKNLLNIEFLQAVTPMVKAILLEDYSPFASKYGLHHCRDGMYIVLILTMTDGIKKVYYKRSKIIRFKVKSNQPKGVINTYRVSSGLPKEGNFYGNGTTIVSNKNPIFHSNLLVINLKRVVMGTQLSKRNYSADRANNVTNKLNYLANIKVQRDEPIRMNLYKFMIDTDFLYNAYDNIKSNPGNMSQGITTTTLDGMSVEVLEKLSQELKTEKFQFKPGIRIHIPKASGGIRPLTIAPPRDKIVQEAMRIILNAIFEPVFHESSHGFRPNRSCHSALQYLKINAQPCTLFIEITKCFDNIDHHKLMKIIESKILDKKFTKLI